jgi:predicted protein tyrosine phosphatase
VNVLFVCTHNQARSVTAERLFRRIPGLQVRSAGTADRARHQVVEDDLAWADLVIVFEPAHERWLRATFTGDLPEIIDVGIPDRFAAEDPALVAELREVVGPLLTAR